MARFRTTLASQLEPAQAFDLLANFDSVADWDPGVRSAERLGDEELRVGSRFRVVADFGPRRIPLIYEVTDLEPGSLVALTAVTGDFTSYDVITVVPESGGCSVTYDATLTLHSWRKPFDPLLQAAFLIVGKRAEAGLRRALNPQPVQA